MTLLNERFVTKAEAGRLSHKHRKVFKRSRIRLYPCETADMFAFEGHAEQMWLI